MNKFLGIYKTDAEYDWRECLILSYGIPLNNKFTEFDFTETLIVDLRSVSQSIADYLRDLTMSTDIYRFKTFAEFAMTRKFQSKDISVLEQLYNMGSTKKVPASAVKIKFKDSINGEYAKTVEEINAMIQAELSQQDQAKEEEVLPLTERVNREEIVHGRYESKSSVEQPKTNVEAEVLSLKAEVSELKDMLKQLVEKPTPAKRGRKPKAPAAE